MNDFERLETDFFDENLSSEKALTLAQRLESDPVAASEFLSLYAVDRLLAVKLGPRQPDAVQAILQQIKREQSSFVQDVLRDITDDLAPRRAAPQSSSVVERLKRLVAFPRWALAGATALMAALFAVWFWPTIGEPEIATALQTRVFINGSEPAVEVSSGRRLNAGDVLKTEPGGATTIVFGKEATQIELGPSTELKITSLARGKHFALSTGKLGANVARQRPFRPLLVRTSQAEARVLGTKFTLAVDTNGTRLEVMEGKVRLTRASDGTSVKVGLGYYSLAQANTELSVLPATGRFLHEVWTNYPGGFIAAMTSDASVADHPQRSGYLTQFETALGPGIPFGQRVRGYVHPPTTGDYSFSIIATGVGDAILFLSPDDKPDNRVQIWEDNTGPTGTGPAPPLLVIPLVAGRRYYIEALHESNTDNGGFIVRWQGPGRNRETIPGGFLSPFQPKVKK